MTTTIDDILVTPFPCRSHEEKLRIVREGKPRPPVIKTVTVKSENGDGPAITPQFDPTLYDSVQWLTGCDKRNALFCWPCLLFKPALGLWNTIGVSDLSYLAEGVPKHEESVEHIHATALLQKLLSHKPNPPVQLSDEGLREFNELVNRNREILKRITDVICNLLVREEPFFKRPKGCQLDPENAVKNLQFLRKYDVLKCNYIDDALDLIKISPKIIHDLMDTITKKVKRAVQAEIQGSIYVSLILNDHSRIAEKAQMSTILRYIKDGKVSEKFVGFMNLDGPRSVSDILQHISSVAAEFGIAERLLAISLDGGMLSTDDLMKFIAKMKELYPFTFFVPWYCHGVEYILHQSLTSIEECSEFLKAMREMKNFFSKKSKRYKSLESFMETNVPSTKNTKWFVRSQFITVVNSYRKYFILFFESILQNSTTWGDADDVTKALGFQQILEEFKTVFLLQVFSKLFEMVIPLNKVLKSPTPENALDRTIAEKLISELFKVRDGGFNDVWTQVHNEKCVELPGPGPKRVKPDFDDPKIPEFRELYNLVINKAIEEIDIRYCSLGVLNFCQLLTSDSVGNEKLQFLSEVHGGNFDKEQTRNELIVLRTNGKVFSNKSVYGLLDLFTKLKLQSGFKYLYRLIQLIITLPIKPPFDQGEVSRFEEIKEWCYIPEVVGVQTGDISVPMVEIDFLQKLKKSNNFHNHVAVLFYETNKSMELIPK